MLFAAHAISALQTIVARNLHPLDAGVVSVTQVHGGDTWNVIPRGGRAARHRALVQAGGAGPDRARGCARIVAGIAATFEMTRDAALRAALPGDRQHRRRRRGTRSLPRPRSSAPTSVDTDPTPDDGQRGLRLHAAGEARLLRLAGRRARAPSTPGLHNPRYDFNDDALAIGASYWVTLAEQQLAAGLTRGGPCSRAFRHEPVLRRRRSARACAARSSVPRRWGSPTPGCGCPAS